MAFEDGKYKAGSFQVPAATGSFSVTGVGFDIGCQGVVFFGSNQDGDDAVITAANAGAFFGIMGQPIGTWPVVAQANSIIPGVGSQSRGDVAIFQLATFGTIDYQADPVSLDADGFTVDFVTLPGSGVRWIHWFAWGDWDDADINRQGGVATLTLGWLVGAMAMVGCVSSGGTVDGDYDRPDLPGFSFAWEGGTTYPLESGLWKSGFQSLCVSTTGPQIHLRNMTSVPTTAVNFGAAFIGPFLNEALQLAYPVGTTDYYEGSSGSSPSNVFAYWNGDGDCGEGTPGATTGDQVVEGLNAITTADAIMFFTAAGLNGGPGSDFNGQAMGFGIWTPDYQGCVLVTEGGNYAFQSKTKSWCSNVEAGGAHAGTTTVQDGEATLTLVTADDAVAPQEVVWVAYGHGGGFIPQIYRRIPILQR